MREWHLNNDIIVVDSSRQYYCKRPWTLQSNTCQMEKYTIGFVNLKTLSQIFRMKKNKQFYVFLRVTECCNCSILPGHIWNTNVLVSNTYRVQCMEW